MSAESSAFNHVMEFRWRQGDPDIPEAEARLHDLGALQLAIAEVVEIAVGDARADELTWTQIGDALGVSAQAAVARYGKRGDYR
ncbi:hypothetical protein [Microbacterium lacticum]